MGFIKVVLLVFQMKTFIEIFMTYYPITKKTKNSNKKDTERKMSTFVRLKNWENTKKYTELCLFS